MIANTLTTEATLSVDGKYRYTLCRMWDGQPPMVWCMLNPSTADASVDDPTIRRCMSFAKREGYGGILVVNLMAYRATDPMECLVQPYPCGPHNDEHLRTAVRRAEGRPIVVAWGARAPRHLVERAVTSFKGGGAEEFRCLGTTKDGSPRHPLYVSGLQPFVEWVETDGVPSCTGFEEATRG